MIRFLLEPLKVQLVFLLVGAICGYLLADFLGLGYGSIGLAAYTILAIIWGVGRVIMVMIAIASDIGS